jgi:HK97 family phage portal protein
VFEKRAGGGTTPVPEDPADWLLHMQASPETPAFQFREAIIAHALTWGNGYAEIERDGAGRPVWLWLLTPDRVRPWRDPNGRVMYHVSNPVGAPTVLEAEDVFHLRGLGFDGLIGYSVIQLAARSISAGISLDQSTAELFLNDSTPGGVLEHPGKLSDQAAKRLLEDWEKRHQGPRNKRRTAILEEGMKWNQTGLPPGDTKLIEQRQFTPSDICRWFRVSPVKVQDLLRATFSNIEELAIWHVTDTLLPWARRLETEANIKLFGRTNRGKRFVKINLHALLRGNTQSQTDHVSKMLGNGVYDINEARDYLDKNPIGPDGEKRFVPVNMQTLERAGEAPPPGSPPGPPGPQPKPPEKEPQENPDDENPKGDDGYDDMRAVLRPVFEDAARRLLRAECERAKSALKGGVEGAAAWLDKVRVDHALYVRNQLRPGASALALSRRIEPGQIEPALAVVAERHLEGLKERLNVAVANAESLTTWESSAAELAGVFLNQLSSAVESAR